MATTQSPLTSTPPTRRAGVAYTVGAIGPIVGVAAAIALLAAAGVRTVGGVGVPVTSLAALALLGGFALGGAGLVRRMAGPRAPIVAALALAGPAFFLWTGARWALSDPLVSSHFRCGTGDIGLAMMTLPALVVLGVAAAVPSTLLFLRERRALDRGLRGLAWVAAALALVLAGLSARKALEYPSTDGWLGRQRAVARMGPVAPGSPPQTTVPVGDFVLRRTCTDPSSAGGCRVRLADPRSPDWSADFGTAFAMPGEELILQHDTSHGYWILTDGTFPRMAWRARPLQLLNPAWRTTGFAFDPVDIHARDVAAAAAPPWGWTLGAFAGVAVALAALLRRGTPAPLPADGEGCFEGFHAGDGTVLFADGRTPCQVPGGTVPAGPVVVVPAGPAPAASYRADGAVVPVRVLPGTVASVRMAARAVPVARAAFALAAVLLTSAPLAAACLEGLVG